MSYHQVNYDVPLELSSYHTALMQGYVPEGHTPVDVAARLLKEKPQVVGLARTGNADRIAWH